MCPGRRCPRVSCARPFSATGSVRSSRFLALGRIAGTGAASRPGDTLVPLCLAGCAAPARAQTPCAAWPGATPVGMSRDGYPAVHEGAAGAGLTVRCVRGGPRPLRGGDRRAHLDKTERPWIGRMDELIALSRRLGPLPGALIGGAGTLRITGVSRKRGGGVGSTQAAWRSTRPSSIESLFVLSPGQVGWSVTAVLPQGHRRGQRSPAQ